MILLDIKYILKFISLKALFAFLWLAISILKLVFFVSFNLYKLLNITLRVSIFVLYSVIKYIVLLIVKVIPFGIVFIFQSIFDLFALFTVLIIITQKYAIKIQEYFLNKINSLYNNLKWQRLLFFNLMFNRFIRTTIKRNLIYYLKKNKNKFIGNTKISIKTLCYTLKFALLVVKNKFINKSKKYFSSIFIHLYLLIVNTLNFFINVVKLKLLIIKSFFYFIVSLFKINIYKNLVFSVIAVIHLVINECYKDIKYIIRICISFPYIIPSYIKKISLNIKNLGIKIINYGQQYYYKTAFITVILVICTINLSLLRNNNNLFLNTLKDYQNSLSITNTVPTVINFFNNLKNNSLVTYKKITLNVKDFKEFQQDLLKFNVDYEEAYQISQAINTAKITENFKQKNTDVEAILVTSKLDENHIRIAQLEIPLNNSYNLIVEPSNNQKYNVYKKRKQITKYLVKQRFVIEENYFNSAYNSKIPPNIISILSNIMSWHIDFQREISPGDSIEVLYQCSYNKNQLISCNNIIYASINLSHKNITFYNYDGKFYLLNGSSAATALLRTPIEGYRISSPFGTRAHPILGYSIFHKGIDFAAPTGTPVPSAGNGIVKKIVVSNSYGKYVEIQHNAYLSTIYAHLNAFVKDLHVGQKVSQREIIGYVGSTGWATGPHLHYEIHFNGRPVNPMDVRIPSTNYLTNDSLNRFNNYKKEISQILLKLPLEQKAAITFNNI